MTEKLGAEARETARDRQADREAKPKPVNRHAKVTHLGGL